MNRRSVRVSFLPALGLALASFVAGCGDTPSIDAGHTDAARRDAAIDRDAAEGAADASSDDSSVVDAGVGEDSGLDAGRRVDAGPPILCEAGGTLETCNRFDDDCDGRVDEAGCGACRSVRNANGHIYLFCPGTHTGYRAWMGACATIGEGYDLATAETLDEEVALTAQADATARWVGYRSFGHVTGIVDTFERPRARESLTFAPDEVSLDGEECFQLDRDGLHDLPCNAPLAGVICEGVERSERPVPATETCNGLDDDLDGSLDEDVCADCHAFTLATHHYWICADGLAWSDARARCQALGADLVTLDSPDETIAMSFQGSMHGSWVGATDIVDEGVWIWVDGRPVAASEPGWNTGEPNGATAANCLSQWTLRGAWDDDDCASPFQYVCERTPLEGP